jgi:predicted transcriptional regulator
MYHELHFAVIRLIYKTPGLTRYEIWLELRDENLPREDSPEADLFKFIIRELSTGGVIRQARNTTEDGRFLKNRSLKHSPRNTMESAFEGTKQYMLTELGKQFVHYTMTDVIKRIEENN